MDIRRVWTAVLAIVVILILGFTLVQSGLVPTPWTEDRATVTIVGENETKAVIDVEVADTRHERYVGLSEHESLERGEGMLFVHESEGERTYVMRDMDFDIDIVFVGADGEITSIHHARAPEPGEDGEDLRYSGQGKWVLEVPSSYVNETGITVGDEVLIEYE